MNLQELEARLQSLIEVDLFNLLPGRKVEDIVIQQLAAAIRLNAEIQEDGAAVAPNVFTLIVHPAEAEKWQDQRLLAILLHSITAAAQEAGFRVTISPTLAIATDEKLSLNDARVLASHRIDAMSETNATPLDSNAIEEQNKMPENAFLIVEGVKVFPLKTPVINIGRRLDNQLVIDDPRVSRNHAQLRAIKGRFVIFDLNSTGGTFVNGQRASQTVLYPGDVISLAGVALIFGQDNPPLRPGLKDATPYSQSNTERPTAVLSPDHSTAKLKRK